MIKSFHDQDTEDLYNGKFVKHFQGFARQGYRRLRILHDATTLEDLAMLPSNKLEKLSGDREGQHSIRINEQWRICFVWTDAPEDVEIIDYHP